MNNSEICIVILCLLGLIFVYLISKAQSFKNNNTNIYEEERKKRGNKSK